MRRHSLFWLTLPAASVVIGCGTPQDQAVHVPAALLGVWVNESAIMADRVFEITPEELFFQTAPDAYTLHAIEGLEVAECEGALDYDLEYRGLSGEAEFFRLTLSGGALRMRSRPEVRWMRNAAPERDWPWRRPGV